MGFLDFLKGKGSESGQAAVTFPAVLGAPAQGTFAAMEQIPDEVFSAGILGVCCGVEPDAGNVYAPIDAKVTQVADTSHAVGLEAGGIELLIHVGIDTVSGTGSECNGGAVITNEELKIKTGRDYPKCNPKFALLDPAYIFSVPRAQMISGGFDTLSHIMEIYFSGPDEENVSDDIAEALMRGVIRDLRAAAENRIIKLNKLTDFQVHMMEHQLGAYANCNHGAGLAVLHPVYYRKICGRGAAKFARFAARVWGIPEKGKSEKALAKAGVEALADFIKELGMPATFKEMGIADDLPLEEIANSVPLTPGGYGRLTHKDVLEIFQEAF